MKTIKVAIAGATGYTGGELIRVLLNHPYVEIGALLTGSRHGQAVSAVHKDLYGDCDLYFTGDPGEPDVLFLCLAHGASREFLRTHSLPAHCKIIDLGNDFRVDNTFGDKTFVYGMPEWFKEDIRRAGYVANPGCFATAVILALAPLAAARLLTSDVHIHAITGATGAGKQPGETTHFSYRASNLSIYKPFTHQHLAEINRTLATLAGGVIPPVNMIPVRGDFTRGIFASVLTRLPENVAAEQVQEYYRNYYAPSPFVHLAAGTISLKEVVNTNKALLQLHFHNGYIHITAAIDNLLKGASGQAVQNMNLLSGFPEDCGLRLKSAGF
ncbi:MAG: N-acetyl-gamma-glutamyl-phosphate reductase [Prevotellaceae bacterium]|jgi:N-acetyl-gamma-glutamyl-phosphate reductase|nr:N-acetyl-gamma-glutamyl-phosphate reductase [Prevotellaceae bacterium]